MLILFIYLISVIEGIKRIIHGFGLAGFVFLLICSAAYVLYVAIEWNNIKDNYDKDVTVIDIMKKRFKPFKKYFIICICLLSLDILLPNQKVIAAMYLLPKMVDAGKSIKNNEKIAQIPDKMLTLLNVKLDGYIEDITQVKKDVSSE
jgi:hypothetical protein